jgi:hypothetical protein
LGVSAGGAGDGAASKAGGRKSLSRCTSARARTDRRATLKVKAPPEPPVTKREAAMQERIDLVRLSSVGRSVVRCSLLRCAAARHELREVC